MLFRPRTTTISTMTPDQIDLPLTSSGGTPEPGQRLERIVIAKGLLEWARKSAGFNQALAAKRLGVSIETVGKWEAGTLHPTIKQLRNIGRIYKRPLAVLLLPQAPRDFDALRDFRTGQGTEEVEWSPELHAEYKRALSQREVFLELSELAAESLPESKALPEISMADSPEAAAQEIRTALGLGEEELIGPDPGAALTAWVRHIERLGVLVLQTKRVGVEEMRAFSISEWPYPVIAVNGGDWVRSKIFSVLHEIAHLALNTGGLCDLHEARQNHDREDEIEHFCNSVAASVLVPSAVLVAHPVVTTREVGHSWTLEELTEIARPFAVSSESLLLRLVSINLATWDLYWTRRRELDQEYARAFERRAQQRAERKGGPSYYVVKARDLGHGYVTSVLDAFQSRAISALDVADYLDVKFEQLPKLEQVVRQ